MSVFIKAERLSESNRKEIVDNLVVQPIQKEGYGYQKDPIYPYVVINDLVKLPFNYAISTLKVNNNDAKKASMEVCFQGSLLARQVSVKNEAIAIMNQVSSCFLSLHCGFGKTCLALYLAACIKMKTAIIIHRLVLIKQWELSIQTFLPSAKYKIVDAKQKKDDFNDYDILLVKALSVQKIDSSKFSQVGFLVIDEAHSFCTEKMIQIMFSFSPIYLLGLSATPHERQDGMDKLIDLFFGPLITRKLSYPHKVYFYKTELTPSVKKNKQGKIDWNSMLEWQATNPERNQLIIDILSFFKDRTFIVLCKRVDHATVLLDMLLKAGESSTILVKNQISFDASSRILISTYSKSGVGFNHPRLDSLLIASDVMAMIEQYHGRIFRRDDVSPMVIDLIDSSGILINHWKERKLYYQEAKGQIMSFHTSFPEFKKTDITTS